MANTVYWERRFVETYIVKARRERYITLLGSQKGRSKILDRLNHALDYDEAKARVLRSEHQSADGLLGLLKKLGVADTCWLMADESELDGDELRIERGVSSFLKNDFGAVIICPPDPIAVYKEESPGRLILLTDEA